MFIDGARGTLNRIQNTPESLLYYRFLWITVVLRTKWERVKDLYEQVIVCRPYENLCATDEERKYETKKINAEENV